MERRERKRYIWGVGVEGGNDSGGGVVSASSVVGEGLKGGGGKGGRVLGKGRGGFLEPLKKSLKANGCCWCVARRREGGMKGEGRGGEIALRGEGVKRNSSVTRDKARWRRWLWGIR